MNHRIAMSPNTFDEEIIPHDKNRFHKKLSNAEINTLEDLFCVMEKDRCFSIEDRPTNITKKAKKYFGLAKDYKMTSIDDLNDVLKGKEVLLVDSKGTNYKIVNAKIINMLTLALGYPYHSTGLNLEVNGQILENTSLKRVFIPAKKNIKSTTLDVNAQEFIPAKNIKSTTLEANAREYIPSIRR